MKTLEDIKKILESTGLPVTYYCWPEEQAPPMPYICYHSPYSNNFAADGVTYFTADHVMIELYSRNVDKTSEKKITDALTAAGIYWDRTEEYLDDEKCYESIFECEV